MTAIGDYNCTLQPGSSNAASQATVNGTTKGRHLLQQRHPQAQQHPPAVSARTLQQAAGSGSQYSCKKLAAGGNMSGCSAGDVLARYMPAG
jgi:hypothetical protein